MPHEAYQVKETKISMLVNQYEMFKMIEHENIDEMTTRFMHYHKSAESLEEKVYKCRNSEKDSEKSFKGLASKSNCYSRS